MSAQVQAAGYQEVGEDPDAHGLFEKLYLWVKGRIFLEATWMFAVMLIVFAGMYVMWTIVWVLGNSVGRLVVPMFMRCCSGLLKRSSDDSGPALTWKEAMPHIEHNNPPASYRLDRSREFQSLAKYLHIKSTEEPLEADLEATIDPRDMAELLPAAVPEESEDISNIEASEPELHGKQ
jgi:hypothetical protein